MYALPNSTLLSKQIPKKAIFEKFALPAAQRQRIDVDIARIDIIARLAQDTLPAVAGGKEVKDIYVLSVSLKTKDYHPDSIKLLVRLIPQRMLFVLCYQQQAQLAIIYEGLHTSGWNVKDELRIPLSGLNFDALWEHLVVTIGDISLNTEQTLDERIQNKQEKEQILKEIEQLERRIDKEKSLGKQMQLRSQINQRKKYLETKE